MFSVLITSVPLYKSLWKKITKQNFKINYIDENIFLSFCCARPRRLWSLWLCCNWLVVCSDDLLRDPTSFARQWRATCAEPTVCLSARVTGRLTSSRVSTKASACQRWGATHRTGHSHCNSSVALQSCRGWQVDRQVVPPVWPADRISRLKQ